MNAVRYIRFGDFTLDLHGPELRRCGRPVRLGPQATRVLALLASRPGELLTRSEIQSRVWAGTIVEFDQSLNTCIRQIRIVLDEHAGAPVFIETVPRRGYRFIAGTSPADAARHAGHNASPDSVLTGEAVAAPPSDRPEPALSQHAQRSSASTRWPRVRRALTGLAAAAVLTAGLLIVHDRAPHGDALALAPPLRFAVLPLDVPAGAGTDIAFLAGAFATDLIDRLSALRGDRLVTVAFSSSAALAGRPVTEAADRLQADHLLTGRIDVADTRVRITLRMTGARDTTTLWHAVEDVDAQDLEGARSRLVERAAAELALRLLPGSATVPAAPEPSTAARLAWARGRWLAASHSASSLERAVPEFEEVVRLDADFAPAHAALARALFWSGRRDEARAPAARAFALDGSHAEANLVLGDIALLNDHDFTPARRHYQRALELAAGRPDAHASLAFWFSVRGKHDDALRHVAHAIELDPLSAIVNSDAGMFHYWARQWDTAAKYCGIAAELQPDAIYAAGCLMDAYVRGDRLAEAAAHLGALLVLEGADSAETRLITIAPPAQAIEAFRSWRAGRIERYTNAFTRARILVDAGMLDRALDELEHAVDQKLPSVLTLAVEPAFDPLNGMPRFDALIRRVLGQATN